MSRHRKTTALIEAAAEILGEHHPMTVRQVFYRLVSRQVIENTRGAYQAVSKALVVARREGLIPWEHIEDRLRQPRHISMWCGLDDFAETAAAAYRRDIWAAQPIRVEVWLEKDALSGIFEDVLDDYGRNPEHRTWFRWLGLDSQCCAAAERCRRDPLLR